MLDIGGLAFKDMGIGMGRVSGKERNGPVVSVKIKRELRSSESNQHKITPGKFIRGVVTC